MRLFTLKQWNQSNGVGVRWTRTGTNHCLLNSDHEQFLAFLWRISILWDYVWLFLTNVAQNNWLWHCLNLDMGSNGFNQLSSTVNLICVLYYIICPYDRNYMISNKFKLHFLLPSSWSLQANNFHSDLLGPEIDPKKIIGRARTSYLWLRLFWVIYFVTMFQIFHQLNSHLILSKMNPCLPSHSLWNKVYPSRVQIFP